MDSITKWLTDPDTAKYPFTYQIGDRLRSTTKNIQGTVKNAKYTDPKDILLFHIGDKVQNILPVILFIIFLASSQVGASDISNKELMKACSEKTIVYGRNDDKKIVRAGERMDGFCSGYLQATFSALINLAPCEANDTNTNPEFLFSVYQQYMKDMKISENESASKTLTQAFRRVAECK